MPDVEVRASPVLPVTDLERALAHYTALGFRTHRLDGTYGFATWRGVELHLSVDPTAAGAEVFLLVPDADEVARAWGQVAGTTPAADREWGMREGSHVDPDGNLLRFGSPLPSTG